MNQLFLFRKNMTPIRKLLLMKMFAGGVPISEYTATGNPLTFNTNVAKPLKSLVLPWTPVQSGTGDPSPTNVRPISGVSAVNLWQTGKNLFGATIEQGSISGSTGENSSADNRIRTEGYIFLKAGKYTISAVNVGDVYRYIYNTNKEFVSGAGFASMPSIITLTNDCYIRFVFRKSSNNEDITPLDISNVQLELGESATPYTPYTGTTKSIVFPALGKNLLPYPYVNNSISSNGITGTANADGTVSLSGEATANAFFNLTEKQILKAGTYTISKSNVSGVRVCVAYQTGGSLIAFGETSAATFTLETETEVKTYIRIANGTNISTGIVVFPMLNTGESAEPYEPYTNTVYGGSLDVVSGVLTVEWSKQSAKWSEFDSGSVLGDNEKRTLDLNPRLMRYEENSVCNMIKTYYNNNSQDSVHYYVNASGNVFYAFLPVDLDGDTVVEICGKLITPQTVQLSAQQISALLGDNVIWSDTNGTNTAIYFKKG